MNRVTNTWDWEGMFDAEGFRMWAFGIGVVLSAVCLILATVALFAGMFLWFLFVPPAIAGWLLYKLATSADVVFDNMGAVREVWDMYDSKTKKQKKEIGKVSPKTLKAMGPVDRAVLKQHWGAIVALNNVKVERSANQKVVGLLERSAKAERKLTQPVDTPTGD